MLPSLGSGEVAPMLDGQQPPGVVPVVRVLAEGDGARGPDGVGRPVARLAAGPEEHLAAALKAMTPSAEAAPSLAGEISGVHPSSCGRLQACLQERLKTEVCGFELTKVLTLLASVMLPVLDASSDWGVTASFYANGDLNWFKAGLTIQVVAGTFAGLFLLGFVGKELGDSDTGGGCVSRCCSRLEESCGFCIWGCCCCLPTSVVMMALVFAMGLAGLAPVVVALVSLKHGHRMSQDGVIWKQDTVKQDSSVLKLAKGMELVLEAVPQSLLQTYIGVSYGQINPGTEFFNPVLAASIALSLFGAGLTLFGLEMEFRNQEGDVTIRLGSRYGYSTLLLRASQLGAAIFWVANLACALKEGALTLVVLTVWLFVWILIESMVLREGGDDEDEKDTCLTVCCFCWMPTYFCLRIPVGSGKAPAVLWATHLLLVGAMVALFYTQPHVPNNYAA